MKCIAFCCIGIEEVLSKDIKEIAKKDSSEIKGGCIFEGNEDEITKFSYFCQSAERIGILLDEGSVGDDPYSIEINLDEKYTSLIKESFAMTCSIVGEKPFKSNEVVMTASEKIKEKINKRFTYGDSDLKFHIQVVDDKYYFLVDVCSGDLSKRDYKIFVNKTSMRGSISYAVARIAGIKDEEMIVDCFCRSGEIGIEAVHHFIGKSIHYYAKDKFMFSKLGWKVNFESLDEHGAYGENLAKNAAEKEYKVYSIDSGMPNVKAAEKNAKIAGVNKLIHFARIPTEDLDLKFDKVIDKIVTQLPVLGKDNEQGVLRIYRDFFNIANKVVKDDGKIICIGLNISPSKKVAETFGYKANKHMAIMQGKEKLDLFVFSKAKSKAKDKK